MYTEVFDVFDKKQVQIPTEDRELRITISILLQALFTILWALPS